MSSPCVSPYGSWKSPIGSGMVSQSSLDRINLQIDSHPDKDDTVYWVESRASEGGRIIVCSSKLGETTVKSWTPIGYNVRTRVHEYGGGAFFVYNGSVYFSNFADQRLYIQKGCDVGPEPLTPEKEWRYADGQFSHKTGKIYCVRESHESAEGVDNSQFALNTIVVIDPVTQTQNILASGADFYSHPRVSPDGTKICWVQWDHPNMPWDYTELWVAELTPSFDGVVPGSAKKIVDKASIMMPSFDQKNELLYISDATDWWNVYHVTSGGDHVNLLPRDEEAGHPHWQFGNEDYGVDPRGGASMVVVSDGKLGELNRDSGEYRVIDTGYTSHSNVYYSHSGHVYCDAGSHNKLTAVIRVDLKSGKVDIIRESQSPAIDPGYLSVPQAITWPANETAVSHGNYYPPTNQDFTAPQDTLPPLLVKVHGGPTANADTRLNYKFQYFTSRGFAILDVNFRGSTGFGRRYRELLKDSWGVVDIEDCSGGALYLADKGLIDRHQVCISGGSAGGYAALACLTFTDTFKAGVSCYGVADLQVLASDCHKFECRYLDLIISPFKGEGIKVYKDRSPIFHLHKLNSPVAFFHGDEDMVLETDCHKFESRYNDLILAPCTTDDGIKILKERSPFYHLDKLNSPVAFFHGDEDMDKRDDLSPKKRENGIYQLFQLFSGTSGGVVPQNQADMMYKAVKEKKLPTSLCVFQGEQHGFRQSANIQKALDGEFYFFARVFGFEPADKDIVQLHIDNLD